MSYTVTNGSWTGELFKFYVKLQFNSLATLWLHFNYISKQYYLPLGGGSNIRRVRSIQLSFKP